MKLSGPIISTLKHLRIPNKGLVFERHHNVDIITAIGFLEVCTCTSIFTTEK